jgi:hypothetical protein
MQLTKSKPRALFNRCHVISMGQWLELGFKSLHRRTPRRIYLQIPVCVGMGLTTVKALNLNRRGLERKD